MQISHDRSSSWRRLPESQDYLKRWWRAVLSSRRSVLIHFARAQGLKLWNSLVPKIDYVSLVGERCSYEIRNWLWDLPQSPFLLSARARWILIPGIATKSKILIAHHAAWVTLLILYRYFTRPTALSVFIIHRIFIRPLRAVASSKTKSPSNIFSLHF